jgi:hypothetical protein
VSIEAVLLWLSQSSFGGYLRLPDNNPSAKAYPLTYLSLMKGARGVKHILLGPFVFCGTGVSARTVPHVLLIPMKKDTTACLFKNSKILWGSVGKYGFVRQKGSDRGRKP